MHNVDISRAESMNLHFSENFSACSVMMRDLCKHMHGCLCCTILQGCECFLIEIVYCLTSRQQCPACSLVPRQILCRCRVADMLLVVDHILGVVFFVVRPGHVLSCTSGVYVNLHLQRYTSGKQVRFNGDCVFLLFSVVCLKTLTTAVVLVFIGR